MENKIVNHLKDKYNPSAIILHGSRAVGKSREHSDWDFLALFDEPPQPPDFRELIENQNIEVISLQKDILEDNVFKEMGVKLQNARVVFDAEGHGERILNAVKSHYANGFPWPATWPDGPNLFMASKIDGMIDYVDEPMVFQKHLGIFYERSLNYWYQVLHKQFSQPVYIAIETIRENDPKYFSHIGALASFELTPQKKIEHAKSIHQLLFKE